MYNTYLRAFIHRFQNNRMAIQLHLMLFLDKKFYFQEKTVNLRDKNKSNR